MSCMFMWVDNGATHSFHRNSSDIGSFFTQCFSMMMAMPWPPPMHAEPTAYLPPRRLAKTKFIISKPLNVQTSPLIYCTYNYWGQGYLSSWTRWAVMRAPEAPRGCPMAIAPPLTLLFSGFSPRALEQARNWGAKASFTCTKQITSMQ